MSENRLTQIPNDKQHDWKLQVDGQEVEFNHIKISTEKFGVGFEIGLRPEGFPGPAFYEKGGAITIPYAFTDQDELLIGLLDKKRPNLSGDSILEAVGGMVDPGESHDQAQARETEEEAGVTMRAEPVDGFVTWNRLYQFAHLENGEGAVKRYLLQVPFELLEKGSDGTYGFSEKAVTDYKFNSAVTFLPWAEACLRTPDAIAASGITSLLAMLRKRNIKF